MNAISKKKKKEGRKVLDVESIVEWIWSKNILTVREITSKGV